MQQKGSVPQPLTLPAPTQPSGASRKETFLAPACDSLEMGFAWLLSGADKH